MEENVQNEAVELKNAIDASIESKAAEVAKGAAESLEAKTAEINTELDTLKNQNVELQKSIDAMKEEFKAPAILKKVGGSEMSLMLTEKAQEIKNLKKGDTVTLDLKNFLAQNGVESAVYGDERVSEIKYDPNFQNRVRNHVMTGTTSQTGAIRHTFETAESDNAAPKTKQAGLTGSGVNAAQTQSSVTLRDVHTPIQTLFNLLTLPQEWQDDVAMIESYLSTRLLSNLMDVEDIQLLRGNGTAPNYNGLATGGRSFADNDAREAYIGSLADSIPAGAANVPNEYDVISAVAAGMANTNFQADKVFLNPIDYTAMVLSKATTQEYVLAQTIAPNGEFKTIWGGIEFVKTPAQTAGTFTLIDSKKSSQYWMREGAQVEFGMNADDFAANNISVRAIIRGALVNYYENGIVSDTFANWQTALQAS